MNLMITMIDIEQYKKSSHQGCFLNANKSYLRFFVLVALSSAKVVTGFCIRTIRPPVIAKYCNACWSGIRLIGEGTIVNVYK